MDRPEVITKQELQNPPPEQSAGMQRGQAFAHDGICAGIAAFPGGASTGWHHHGIHRELVAAEGGEGVVVRVGGVGATVFNVEGPDPAT
jgi:hypothetical protein